jgi:hypothetical protein
MHIACYSLLSEKSSSLDELAFGGLPVVFAVVVVFVSFKLKPSPVSEKSVAAELFPVSWIDSITLPAVGRISSNKSKLAL